MTDPKDSESFFRKVARFVANPTTDWAEINSRQDDPEADAAKAELRAMVERKRRNDFVRKRELDMLRRIRREGLSPEQLAALGASTSRMDEVERLGEGGSRIDLQVKAKIDEIEQQMVGESFTPRAPGPSSGFFETSTRAASFAATGPSPLTATPSAETLPSTALSKAPSQSQAQAAPPAPLQVLASVAALPPVSPSPPSAAAASGPAAVMGG